MAILVTIGMPVYRLSMNGESHDPDLLQQVQTHIRAGVTREYLPEMQAAIRAQDEGRLSGLMDTVRDDFISVDSVSVTRSVLRRNDLAIVRVQYRAGGEPKTEYMAFRYNLIGGWIFQRRSTAFSYYTNML